MSAADLLEAARAGDVSRVKHLLDSGVNINASDYNHLSVVRHLVDRDTDVNITNDFKLTALHVAGSGEVVDVLAAAGANTEVQDVYGQTPLIRAAYDGRLSSVSSLLRHGANINAQDEDGRTAAHEAVRWNKLDVLQELLTARPDLSLRDGEGRTVMETVQQRNRGSACGELLQQHLAANTLTESPESAEASKEIKEIGAKAKNKENKESAKTSKQIKEKGAKPKIKVSPKSGKSSKAIKEKGAKLKIKDSPKSDNGSQGFTVKPRAWIRKFFSKKLNLNNPSKELIAKENTAPKQPKAAISPAKVDDLQNNRPFEEISGDLISFDRTEKGDLVKLGVGGFGVIYKGEYKKLGNRKVAIKRIRGSEYGIQPRDLKSLKKEAEMMFSLRHPSIVTVFGLVADGSNPEDQLYAIITEYMNHGSLESLMQKVTIPWPVKVKMLKDACLGLCYLANPQSDRRYAIIHGDVKASNILVDLHFNAKISDFGTSRLSRTTMKSTRRSFEATITHTAPELLDFDVDEDGKTPSSTELTDVWM